MPTSVTLGTARLLDTDSGTNARAFPLFRCPTCGHWAMVITKEQYEGTEPVRCDRVDDPNNPCTYNEAHDWSGGFIAAKILELRKDTQLL